MSGSDVPVGWETRRLSQVVLLSDSGTWGDPGSPADGLPVLRSTNINEWELDLNADLAYRCVPERDKQRKRLQYGDIIVTKSSGSPHLIGEAALFNVRDEQTIYLFSNFTQRLRPDQSIVIPRYLHLYLKSPTARNVIGEMQRTTSGLRNLKLPEYEAQPVPLPCPDDPARSLETQRRIVARIEALFAELRECRKLHQAVVEDTNRLMEAVLAEVFRELKSKTEILESVCSIIGGGSLPSADEEFTKEDGVLLLKVSELNREENTPVITTATHSISVHTAQARRLRIVAPGAVIIPKRGGAIATNKKRLLAKHAILDPNLMAITPNDPNSLRPRFLLYWFENLDLTTISSGSTVPQLNRGDLAPLQIPDLGVDVQDLVVAQLDQVRTELFELRKIQSEDRLLLTEMEQAILGQAFRGEL